MVEFWADTLLWLSAVSRSDWQEPWPTGHLGRWEAEEEREEPGIPDRNPRVTRWEDPQWKICRHVFPCTLLNAVWQEFSLGCDVSLSTDLMLSDFQGLLAEMFINFKGISDQHIPYFPNYKSFFHSSAGPVTYSQVWLIYQNIHKE